MMTSKSLAYAFRSNALFSLLSAAAMTLGVQWLSGHLGGLDHFWLYGFAVALVVFAGQLLWMSWQASQLALLVNYVIVADGLFVVGSLGATILFFEHLSATGAIVLIAVALAVFAIACWQYRAWRNLSEGRLTA